MGFYGILSLPQVRRKIAKGYRDSSLPGSLSIDQCHVKIY
jgi:hypothetical protein